MKTWERFGSWTIRVPGDAGLRTQIDGARPVVDPWREVHLKRLYDGFLRRGDSFAAGVDDSLIPHAYYVMAGAASLIFAVAPECRRLTDLDPGSAHAVETHAELVARLLVP